MKTVFTALLATLLITTGCCTIKQQLNGGFISIFNGKDLSGWQNNNEVPNCFGVTDGQLVVKGGRAHLFYNGDAIDYNNLTSFHFKAMVKTTAKSNSGIFFHTQFQKDGWPSHGYECQVNITQKDKIKSGSIYGVKNVATVPATDGQWYLQEIIVNGNHIITKINGEIRADYTEPNNLGDTKRKLSKGTFAIQGHDPTCLVYIKDIMVKPL